MRLQSSHRREYRAIGEADASTDPRGESSDNLLHHGEIHMWSKPSASDAFGSSYGDLVWGGSRPSKNDFWRKSNEFVFFFGLADRVNDYTLWSVYWRRCLIGDGFSYPMVSDCRVAYGFSQAQREARQKKQYTRYYMIFRRRVKIQCAFRIIDSGLSRNLQPFWAKHGGLARARCAQCGIGRWACPWAEWAGKAAGKGAIAQSSVGVFPRKEIHRGCRLAVRLLVLGGFHGEVAVLICGDFAGAAGCDRPNVQVHELSVQTHCCS